MTQTVPTTPSHEKDGAAPKSSYSELVMHRTCPQKWQYAHHRGLEKIESEDVMVERTFGSWWHLLRAADALARGQAHDSLKALPRKLRAVQDAPKLAVEHLTVLEVIRLANHWWSGRSSATKDIWTERIGEELPHRLSTLYDRWNDQWHEDIATERPLAVELFWRRPLPSMPGPDTSTNGTRIEPGIDLIGFVDEVYLDTRRNLVVTRDHKVAKALASQTAADDMMDSQLQLYAWGASPLVSAWGLGPVRATAYDRARMVKPRTPQITQIGNLSKSVTDYDLHTYVAWARGEDGMGVPFPGRKADGSGAGHYQPEPAVVDKLSSPASRSIWFQRTLVPLNINLIRAHLRAAVDSAVDLAMTRRRSEAFGEAARNLSANCRYCEFVKLCRAEMVGGPGPDIAATTELADFGLRTGR